MTCLHLTRNKQIILHVTNNDTKTYKYMTIIPIPNPESLVGIEAETHLQCLDRVTNRKSYVRGFVN